MIASNVFIEQKSIETMVNVWQNLEILRIRQLSFGVYGKYKRKTYSGNCFQNIGSKLRVIDLSSYVLDKIAFNYIQRNRIQCIEILRIYSMEDFTTLDIISQCCPNIRNLTLQLMSGALNKSNVFDFWSALASFKNLILLDIFCDDSNAIISRLCIRQLANNHKLTRISLQFARIDFGTVAEISECFHNWKI